MPVIDVRDLLAFHGDNSTDAIVGDIHFNRTTLDHWNYTLFDNGTLSNGSWCLLTFEPYTPTLVYPNGSFVNATWCWSPIYPIGVRAKIGIALAVVYGFFLVLTLMCLRIQGRLFLPADRRFRPIGRRWQWYWGALASVTGLISLFVNVDVDRYYLPELPIVLTSFFWFLMQMCILATVWEAVRHWGSWQERQFIDPNPFALPQDDRRSRFELLIPLVFYLFWWLNFFMIVPRNWGDLEKQRSVEQMERVALPSATDVRFKIAAFMLLAAWLVIVTSLHHSLRHYRKRNGGLASRAVGVLAGTPLRHVVLLFLSLAMIAYQALCAWEFQWSVLKVQGNRVTIFVGGYLPSLLILAMQLVYGFTALNEDRELIRQRRLRGVETDRELGIVHKPAWWQRTNGNYVPPAAGESMRDRIARNVREIGGGRATTARIERVLDERATAAEAEAVEMNNLSSAIQAGRESSVVPSYTSAAASVRSGTSARPLMAPYGGRSERRRTERTLATAASMLFPGEAPPVPSRQAAELMTDGPPPPYRDGDAESNRGRPRTSEGRPGTSERSNSTGTLASLSAPAQQIRSMLDV